MRGQRRPSIWRRLAALPVLALLLVSCAAPVLAQTNGTPAAQPRQVTVGLYLNDVATLDQTTGSFGADFYL